LVRKFTGICPQTGRSRHYSRAPTDSVIKVRYQAVALSRRPTPAGSRPLLDWLAAIVAPIEEDRPFGEDIERLVAAPWPPA
jgi:hypothetical protein